MLTWISFLKNFISFFVALLGFFFSVRGLFSSCGELGRLHRCGMKASHCSGFSCCRGQALECVLSNCGTWVLMPCGMGYLPAPGIKLMSLSWQADS